MISGDFGISSDFGVSTPKSIGTRKPEITRFSGFLKRISSEIAQNRHFGFGAEGTFTVRSRQGPVLRPLIGRKRGYHDILWTPGTKTGQGRPLFEGVISGICCFKSEINRNTPLEA